MTLLSQPRFGNSQYSEEKVASLNTFQNIRENLKRRQPASVSSRALRSSQPLAFHCGFCAADSNSPRVAAILVAFKLNEKQDDDGLG